MVHRGATILKRLDLEGKRFGSLEVVSFSRMKRGHSAWMCRCDCGTVKEILGSKLIAGEVKSCGCKHYEPSTKHGQSDTVLYAIWRTMKSRCMNPNSEKYPRYGGRGIKVCDEWVDDFKAFSEWATANGYRKGLSIDRINNDGNYEPSNCRWSTPKEQANNTSRNLKYYYNGSMQTVLELSKIAVVDERLLRNRLYKGWSVDRAISTPKITTTVGSTGR